MQTLFPTLLLVFYFILASNTSNSQTSWKGATSVNWATSTNWTNGAQASTTDVVIDDANLTGEFQPAISASSTAESLPIGGSVSSPLTIASTLTVKGNVNINPVSKPIFFNDGSIVEYSSTMIDQTNTSISKS